MSDKTQNQSTHGKKESTPAPAKTSTPGASTEARTSTDRELGDEELKRVAAGRAEDDQHRH